MKKTREQNFERELPAHYKQALYINAKNAKFGIVFNLIAVAVVIAVMTVAILLLHAGGALSWDIFRGGATKLLVAYAVFIVALLGYIVLHEITHGIAYKALTGEKLTFGMSWSCAFCGVPHIFTYRKTAVISVVAPFAL